jgi:cell division protease FtsH
VRKQEPRPVWLSSDRRGVSDQPPVLTPAERAAIERGEDPNAKRPGEEHPPVAVIETPPGGSVGG